MSKNITVPYKYGVQRVSDQITGSDSFPFRKREYIHKEMKPQYPEISRR